MLGAKIFKPYSLFGNPFNFQVEEAFTKFDTSGDQR